MLMPPQWITPLLREPEGREVGFELLGQRGLPGARQATEEVERRVRHAARILPDLIMRIIRI
jgi:hypothetical protein